MKNHKSDCALHDAPAFEVGTCNCGSEEVDAKEIQKVYALERGKIYCLQVDIGAVDVGYLEALMEGFKILDITIIFIDKTMNFVPVPVPIGYELTEKGKQVLEELKKENEK